MIKVNIEYMPQIEEEEIFVSTGGIIGVTYEDAFIEELSRRIRFPWQYGQIK